jgi:hypothetical protein
VADTVSTVSLLTAGAVYRPDWVIEPCAAVHFTDWFVEPDTLAFSCFAEPAVIARLPGEMLTETALSPEAAAFSVWPGRDSPEPQLQLTRTTAQMAKR